MMFATQLRKYDGPATIIQHCAVFGRLETAVRHFSVGDVRADVGSRREVPVCFIEPRKRRRYFYTMRSEGTRYLTIEVGGQVVYDSREDVPIDMGQWADVRARFKGRPGFQHSYGVVG